MVARGRSLPVIALLAAALPAIGQKTDAGLTASGPVRFIEFRSSYYSPLDQSWTDTAKRAYFRPDGQLQRLVNENGDPAEYSYDQAGLLLERKVDSWRPEREVFRYSADGKLLERAGEPQGPYVEWQRVTHVYDALGVLECINYIDSRGTLIRRDTEVRDDGGRVSSTRTEWSAESAFGQRVHTEQFVFDALGRQIRKTDIYQPGGQTVSTRSYSEDGSWVESSFELSRLTHASRLNAEGLPLVEVSLKGNGRPNPVQQGVLRLRLR